MEMAFFRAFSTEVKTARLSRPWWIRRDSGNGATQKETARPRIHSSRTRRRQRDFPDQGGDGTTFQTNMEMAFFRAFSTEVETARLSRPWWIRRDSKRNGATKNSFLATKAETERLSRPRWRLRNKKILCDRGGRRRDFTNQTEDSQDHGAYGKTFQNKAETARLSRPRQRRRFFRSRRRGRDFPDHRGDGATKNQFLATKAETTRLSKPKRRRRDFSDQNGNGAIFQTEAEVARPRLYSSRPRWRRRDFPDQSGDDATFQTKAETARLFRPRRKRRHFPDRSGDGATKN